MCNPESGPCLRRRCGAVGTLLLLAVIALAACIGAPAHAAPRPGQKPALPTTEVVLLRGLFNVFSLGMDDLGRKLERQFDARRVSVTVTGHGAWSSIAQDIIARRKPGGPAMRLVLIGHSLGANDIISMAQLLDGAGVSVDLLVPIDATAPPPIPANVRRVVNFFQSTNGFGTVVVAGSGFRGSLVNADAAGNRRDLANRELGHSTIDKSAQIHKEIIALVAGVASARGRGRR